VQLCAQLPTCFRPQHPRVDAVRVVLMAARQRAQPVAAGEWQKAYGALRRAVSGIRSVGEASRQRAYRRVERTRGGGGTPVLESSEEGAADPEKEVDGECGAGDKDDDDERDELRDGGGEALNVRGLAHRGETRRR